VSYFSFFAISFYFYGANINVLRCCPLCKIVIVLGNLKSTYRNNTRVAMDSDLPVTRIVDIPRWCTTSNLEGSGPPPDEVEREKRSPFAFNPTINSKIAYWYL